MGVTVMKRIFYTLFAIALFLTACNTDVVGSNTLFDDVTAGTSVHMRVYDGEKFVEYQLFDRPDDVPLTEKLAGYAATPSKKTAHDLNPTKKHPIYELEMYTELGGLVAAYCDGLLVMTDGSTYDFGYDFSKLLKDYNFRETDDVTEKLEVRYWYALDGDRFDKNHLQKIDDVAYLNLGENVPGVTLEFTSFEEKDGLLYVNSLLKNNGAQSFTYGQTFYLEVEIDGEWYYLPNRPDRAQFFYLLAYDLQPGNSDARSDCLYSYSPLPAGNYRVTIADGISAVFAID